VEAYRAVCGGLSPLLTLCGRGVASVVADDDVVVVTTNRSLHTIA